MRMQNKFKSYRDLIAWQKAIQLVKSVYFIANKFPSEEKFGLCSQLKRSAISVPSNIAEGWGRNSIPNFRNFLNIASASLCEVESLVEVAMEVKIISIEEYKLLLVQTSEISKIIRGLIKSLSENYVNEIGQEYY